jgi:hypothetical protein
MNINITVDATGAATVRTSLGGMQVCSSENDAVVYANGLQDGYNAAVSSLQRCHGWHIERKDETRR